jgi:hypothetical protein
MFRNQYDTDVTVWSPEGRLLQVRTIVQKKKFKNFAVFFFFFCFCLIFILFRFNIFSYGFCVSHGMTINDPNNNYLGGICNGIGQAGIGMRRSAVEHSYGIGGVEAECVGTIVSSEEDTGD